MQNLSSTIHGEINEFSRQQAEKYYQDHLRTLNQTHGTGCQSRVLSSTTDKRTGTSTVQIKPNFGDPNWKQSWDTKAREIYRTHTGQGHEIQNDQIGVGFGARGRFVPPPCVVPNNTHPCDIPRNCPGGVTVIQRPRVQVPRRNREQLSPDQVTIVPGQPTPNRTVTVIPIPRVQTTPQSQIPRRQTQGQNTLSGPTIVSSSDGRLTNAQPGTVGNTSSPLNENQVRLLILQTLNELSSVVTRYLVEKINTHRNTSPDTPTSGTQNPPEVPQAQNTDEDKQEEGPGNEQEEEGEGEEVQ